MKRGKILLLLYLSSAFTYGQLSDSFRRDILLAERVKNFSEGYCKSSGMNDFTYHSFREDVGESMLTRCTNGKMSIQWTTAAAPENVDSTCGFIWMAAMDLTEEECRFDLFIDGIKRFEIISGPEPELNTRCFNGGSLEFYPVEIDHHGDAHGYMLLEAPPWWLSPGKPLEIRITGSDSGSNTWIIVYKANDALSYLKNKARYSMQLETIFQKSEDKYDVLVRSPQCFAGRTLEIITGDNKLRRQLQDKNNCSEARFVIEAQAGDNFFIIKDSIGKIVDIENLREAGSETSILHNLVLVNELKVGPDNLHLDAQRLYRPKTGSKLLELSRSKMRDGTIYLINSSHQDIAWMDTPEKCVIERDTMLLDPLFAKAVVSDSYRFDIEDVLMIREYIERHPEKRALISDLLNTGKIACGSTFIQPYEEMYSGEALARQFYFGARWLKEEFNYDADIYWNVDVPGRTMQMPQIMKKAGTDFMVFSRFEEGFYNWYSPDGSFVTAYSPGHYANAFLPLQKEFFEAARFISENALSWADYYDDADKPPIPLLSDWDMSPAKDYSHLVDNWMNITTIENENGIFEDVNLPDFRITTAGEFLKALIKEADNIPSIRGERPAMWLYIHGPSHYQALKVSREADILLTKAEKYNSALAAVKGSFEYYPTQELNSAWEAKIYPDHGWGGKGGEITDNLFLMKFSFARSVARRLLEKSLLALSAEINVNHKYGKPLVVYNSMNGVRTDIASIRLVFPANEGNTLVLKDKDGNKVRSQLTEPTWNSDGSLHSATLVFLASEVPSIGYKTYYYKMLDAKENQKEIIRSAKRYSNSYYDIKLSSRGIEYLYDKELKEQIIDNEQFAGGEVITMNSVGNGAGEFSEIQQADMSEYDFTGSSTDSIDWEIVEDGDVFTRLKIRQPVKYAEVERQLTIYHVMKKIDFDVSLLNWEGKLYREFRMLMPLKQVDAEISYEVPFGVVRVGKDEIAGAAGERYTTKCSDIHPRGIQNWISSNNHKFGLTLSSDVVVADYIDPLDEDSGKSVLQAVLLASRKSCHGQGNEYLQTGDHNYHFSFTSHQPGWENGYLFGIGSNETMDVVKTFLQSSTASLPESMSFFSTGNKNLIISTVKKSEDENALVTRMYEIEGEDTEVQFKMFKDIENVHRTDLIEYPLGELKGKNRNGFNAEVGKYSIETFKLQLKRH